MKPDDFDLFATLMKERSGVMLTREKAYLLESRLLPVARKHNLKSLEDMADAIRDQHDEVILHGVTEAMTTNESCFFRDQKPFVHFRQVLLPQLLNARAAQQHIRIWSTAASSGQEAYSIAMICAEEAAKLEGWTIDIIGTDLSHTMIERAKSGIYNHFEVQRGLPITMLIKYFQRLDDDKWQIRENIRHMVQFHDGNLLQDFSPTGVFDIVFCRNVLFYFDLPTKARVLDAIGNVLAPDGVLFLGSAETVAGITEKFRPVDGQYGVYAPSSLQSTSLARQTAV